MAGSDLGGCLRVINIRMYTYLYVYIRIWRGVTLPGGSTAYVRIYAYTYAGRAGISPSFPRKREVFAYVGITNHLKDLKGGGVARSGLGGSLRVIYIRICMYTYIYVYIRVWLEVTLRGACVSYTYEYTYKYIRIYTYMAGSDLREGLRGIRTYVYSKYIVYIVHLGLRGSGSGFIEDLVEERRHLVWELRV